MSVDVAAAAQLACLLEASAPKPGNVSPGRHFTDARYEDFLASAAAIGPAMAAAGERPLGATVRAAIEATATWTRSNTNLGLVLLLAPIARAAHRVSARGGSAAVPARHEAATGALRAAVRDVLGETTVQDARDVYAAIRRASPGGLGTVPTQDVAHEPTVTLQSAMELAAPHDGIAREYATGFATTFQIGAPALVRARRDGLSWDDAIVECFLTLLAAAPDTHIARRAGADAAQRVTQSAADAVALGGVRTAQGERAIAVMDAALRDGGNGRNPGTTADLTGAAILVAVLCGGWPMRPSVHDDAA